MILETCIDSIESALAAERGGAHRIEICNSLSSGGTTPSAGLVQQCVQHCKIPAMVMVRPHDGGFVYSDDDIGTMLHDIELFKKMDVAGIVLGALTAQGEVDIPAMKQLIDASRPLPVTFHRAFDMARDPLRTLDAIIDLGVQRLLTSGQRRTASEGVPLIKQLVLRAGDRLTVMAGSGINHANANKIVTATGVQEVHAGASIPRTSSPAFGDVSFGDHSRTTCEQRVRELVQAIS